MEIMELSLVLEVWLIFQQVEKVSIKEFLAEETEKATEERERVQNNITVTFAHNEQPCI